MNAMPPGALEWFPAELMDTSRVASRGGTCSSRERTSSSLKAFAASFSNRSSRLNNSTHSHAESPQPAQEEPKERELVVEEHLERTRKKEPIHVEIEVRQPDYRSLDFEIRGRQSGLLLSYPLSKRTSNEYRSSLRVPLLQPFLRERGLEPIREEAALHWGIGEEIDSDQSQRLSSSTDISSRD